MPGTAKIRTDSWTDEHDAILTDIVLNSIRFGKTQLSAFEHAAQLIGRTSAACGFRWNGVLRKRNAELVQRAKKEWKALKGNNQPLESDTSITEVEAFSSASEMGKVIQFLQEYDDSYQELLSRYSQVVKERDELLVSVRELEKVSVHGQLLTPEQLAEDTQTLIKILERARHIVIPNEVLPESV